jgi:exopolysaccharide biosynthesis polyprenyl glycosylphosphotransferase
MAESVPVDAVSGAGEGFFGSFWPEQSGEGEQGYSTAVGRASPVQPTAIDPTWTKATVDGWTAALLQARSIGVPRLLYALVLKRWIDAALATVALVVLSPLLLLIALAVCIDSRGPALFRQTRIGRGGDPFVVFKFRTMVADADPTLVRFRAEDGTLQHKIKNDPRVTRVGKVLRRTSLDELPQLLNVVRGEMSLVGPRPELPEIVQTYEPWQHRRHLVRPGMTGWWQVQGRSELPMHKHTELDLFYVANLSMGLDVEVMMRTFRVVLFGSGAF